MVSYIVTAKKRKNKKTGETVFYLHHRIAIDGDSKPREKSLGIKIPEQFWDEGKKKIKEVEAFSIKLSLLLDKKNKELDNHLLNLRIKSIQPNWQNVWPESDKKSGNKAKGFHEDMIAYIPVVLEEEAERKNPKGKKPSPGTVRGWRSKLNKLKGFVSTLNMHNTNEKFLRDYQAYLEQSADINAYSSVHGHLKFLRKFWNLAIKDDLTENYPFKHFVLPDPEFAEKEFLTRTERKALMDLLDDDNIPGYLRNTLVNFLIACYTGLRYGDWHQAKHANIKEGDLYIWQGKKDGKLLVIPITQRVSDLLLLKLPHWKTFPDYDYRTYLKELTQIAKIKKHVTTHVGRHTFCMMCLNEADMTYEKVAQLIDDDVETVKKHYARYHTTSRRRELEKLNDL
jgi:integrase